jgi:hypothetical protein
MAQSFNLLSPRLSKFFVPRIYCCLADIIPYRGLVHRSRTRFAQDFCYLTFRMLVRFLHSYVLRHKDQMQFTVVALLLILLCNQIQVDAS